ncbi:nuclear receptor binding SET domain protein [Drosophila nasuta]|uniref:nuclear receptor binding SET domain protein n=1 Tax=Drosophila nasuta TaxID=42062 RepID=UPI00295E7BC1|nr:nuclear receptor binding SET domain protein [Drosophila nasuta]
MKLSSSDTHPAMEDDGVADTSAEDNATAGNVAIETTATVAATNQQKAKQRFPGKMFFKRRRGLANDAGSATDSTDFTENELQTSIDNQTNVKKHRKRDLINLQSNLSPKYIGYANANSPSTITDSADKMRSMRRRNNHSAIALNNNNGSNNNINSSIELNDGNRDHEIEAVVMTSPKHLLLPNGSTYMSPIDKLLIKNGANSPNSTGFEADAEDVIINPMRKRKLMKRGPRAKAKSVQQALQESVKDEMLTVSINPEADVEIKLELLEMEMEKQPAPPQEFHTTEDLQVKVEDDEATSKEPLLFALPTATSTELEAIKSPPDSNEQSLKSPSSISLDSAKGSSITNDSGWSTYQAGDLYWGKLFTYCYWPCMVCPDEFGQIVGSLNGPPQRKSTDSANGASQTVAIQVHVRFFADNGRHNWIKSENLLPFGGLKAFEELREEVRIKHGAKSLKYRQMVAKQNKLLVWRQAIEEAQQVGEVSYEQRLEKFFEIHEQNISHKEKRRHSKPQQQQDTSDVGSSLYDSNDNLHAKPSSVLALKRERSSSPLSPAFSPVKSYHDKRSKRRKLSGLAEEHVGNSHSIDEQPFADVVNYENPEFGQLFDAIKEYVMVHRQEKKVETVLLAVVRNIWSLKQLQLRELERDLFNGDTELLGSARVDTDRGKGAGTIKRLSNRLKTMVLRRSLTPVVQQQQSTTPTTEINQLERQSSEPPKVKKPLGRPIEEVIQDIVQLDRKYLFRGLNREPVCKYCHQPGGDLERCSLASCHSWFHGACVEQVKTTGKLTNKASSSGRKAIAKPPQITAEATTHITGDGVELETEPKQPQMCHECATGQPAACCICHDQQPPMNASSESPHKEQEANTKLLSCSQPMCSNHFHPSCCKYWPQASINNSTSRCPMHVCHTCVSDDPSGKFQQLGSSKLIKCVKCPATYHQDSRCIPAGSQMLTASHLICPRHNVSKADANLNVLWCYICVRGGELVCCETCPIAVHAHCRNIPIKSNESYICEECESGRLPLYGEIVWAKFTHFRWWPAIILPPTEIPSNIQKKPHGLNDFVVRFFGTNDHGWISRRRVYLYIEGDTGDGNKSKSVMSKRYTAGVEEATHFLKILKQKRQEQSVVRLNNKLLPPPYVKIKTNKPVPPVRFAYNEEYVNICECKPGTPHPCGPESGCLNRMLYNECHPEFCPAGAQCENQLFELRKSPRLDVVYMHDRGFGLVCREPIAEGTFIIEYVGEVINHAEFQRRMAQKTSDRDENFYFLGVEKDFIIDAGPKGNLARFMNHSCEPNCATQKWTVNCINRVGLFAIKDIPENTELTFNYLWDDLMNNGKKACFCGAKRCSGEIGGKLKDEETKESGSTSGKSKTNGKLKQLQRNKGIKIHINGGGVTKKRVRKPKPVAVSDSTTQNSLPASEPTQSEPLEKE